MSPPDDSTTLTLNDTHAEEGRMRAALGLTPEPAHPPQSAEQSRTPSGQEFERPLTVVSIRHPSEAAGNAPARLATLSDELKVERSERIAAQQALADAQRSIQQLHTKLAHAEMAAAEALEAEQRARLTAEARLMELARQPASKVDAEKSAAKKRGRSLGNRQVVEEPEQQPVQWWLPSNKAANTKRARPQS